VQFFQDAAHERASASRPSGELCDGDNDVLANGIVVGRIYQDAGAFAFEYTSDVPVYLGSLLNSC
jgi:hypothetical protein